MEDIKALYQARREAEETGVWVQALGEAEVQIRAVARNKEFVRLMKGVNSGQQISDDKLFLKLATVCAKTVVVDWSGFGCDYSEDAFITFCTDLRECGFLEDVLSLARDGEIFDQVAVAKSAKNL